MSTGFMNVGMKEELSSEQLSIVQSEMQRKQKNVAVAFILWFFLGWAGAHRFYTDRIGSGIAMLGLNICGVICYFIGLALLSVILGFLILPIGFILSLAFLVWWIVDAVKLQDVINYMNAQIEADIINSVKKMESSQG
ncbi:MAG TPA: TM2 domain-containing protein [Pseudogracilibacillus sp.]|nr:TM2 domain-containing protein [Pseudogracilibacillus sp.]